MNKISPVFIFDVNRGQIAIENHNWDSWVRHPSHINGSTLAIGDD